MDLYLKNLEFFKNYLPSIYDIITEEISIIQSNIETLDYGNNIIIRNNDVRCFLHSQYSIDEEMKRMFSGVDKNTERIIIFGAGLGYSLNYICDNFPKLKRIIIIEPDLNVFKHALNFINIEEILIKLKNVTFIINKSQDDAFDILWASLQERIMEGVELVYNTSYRTLYEGYYETISTYLKEYIQNTLLTTVTENRFLYLWSENTIKNCRFNSIPIENFFHKFDNIPAIIVSAGPSLNKTMKYLKELKNRALIIAVGSAIKILDTHGIVPHFRFAFDGGEAEKKIFDGIDTSSCPLIYGAELYSGILPEYKGEIVKIVLDLDYLSRYIHRKLRDNINLIASGFSVANIALDTVIKMGFKKVIFMGQDLSYTNGELYAKGSATENKNIDFSVNGYIKTKDIYGNDVFTTKPFMGMKTLFESIISNSKNIEFINATAGGLNIEGAVNKSIEEVINNELFNECNIDQNITLILNDIKNKTTYERIKEELLDILSQVKDIKLINDERLKKLKKLNKYIEKGIKRDKVLFELSYMNIFEEKIMEKQFYSEVIVPILNTKFKSISAVNYYSGEDKNRIILSQYKTMSGKSYEIDSYINLIKQLIEEQLVI